MNFRDRVVALRKDWFPTDKDLQEQSARARADYELHLEALAETEARIVEENRIGAANRLKPFIGKLFTVVDLWDIAAADRAVQIVEGIRNTDALDPDGIVNITSIVSDYRNKVIFTQSNTARVLQLALKNSGVQAVDQITTYFAPYKSGLWAAELAAAAENGLQSATSAQAVGHIAVVSALDLIDNGLRHLATPGSTFLLDGVTHNHQLEWSAVSLQD
jgi:hypothetical protein